LINIYSKTWSGNTLWRDGARYSFYVKLVSE